MQAQMHVSLSSAFMHEKLGLYPRIPSIRMPYMTKVPGLQYVTRLTARSRT